MFSSTARAVHIEHLRDLLAEKQEEARRYHRVAAERPTPARTVAVAVAVPAERHPRLRLDTAFLRSLIDRRRPGVIRELLQGKAYLLQEFVRISPNQTALEYAMEQDQDQGIQDIIAVLREGEKVEEG